MGNGMLSHCRNLAIWYLKLCGLGVSDEHSLGQRQLLIIADMFVSVAYGAGNLWMLCRDGVDFFVIFFNLLCLLHAIFATGISRSEYFRTLTARKWSGKINYNAYLRVIIVELICLGANLLALAQNLSSNPPAAIAVAVNIVLVLLDTIRVDLAIMFGARPT